MYQEQASLADLQPGDFVVHLQHGIGLYQGIERLKTAPTEDGPPLEKEYLRIEYEGGDALYVPVDQTDRVQKYVGAEGALPALNTLRGGAWAKTLARAKEQVQGIARELAALYAARQAIQGHAYGPDTPAQRAMEAAFPYDETPDQAAAIRDVKSDLEAPRPMDRLLVGDVGYGKTEVAIRAAFKVATAGRQVAVLCPTAVLAAQHDAAFRERLAGRPVRVETLSRFRSHASPQEVLEGLRSGDIDIVIGTHRLLSADVEFHDLGLVIVDEEQRFGVAHKERLKELRQTVDVLTMTATPIPRTLQQALSGLRSVSQIHDPPVGRTPVETVVAEYDDGLIRDGIRRELERGGQAYLLHNRIETIETVAAHVQELVPDARIEIAHGQMAEDELERTMLDFHEYNCDVLVCTTLIESGIDVPRANTIIVDEADRLGLAQLHQIRGRVGRSATQAYAYLLHRPDKDLTDAAAARLAALQEFSDLGAGYAIARRDLELRGAGSLLGVEQSGPVAAVGFALYLRLLSQAVSRAKGEKPDPHLAPLPPVELPVDASLPARLIPDGAERLRLYERLAAVRDTGEFARLRQEFSERWETIPPPVENALALAALRLRCRRIGVKSITTEGRRITVSFRKRVRLPVARMGSRRLDWEAQGHTLAEDKLVLCVAPSDDVLSLVSQVVETLAGVLKKRPT